jgi:hypothetical protein
MDEQRILEEMERMLAADDPRLAAKLAAFGQPSVAAVLRTRRARAALSLLMLAVIAAAAAVIYLVSAFRIGAPSAPHGHHTSHQTVPLPTRVICQVQVAPHTCLSWMPAPSGGAQHPGAAGPQATGAGHTAHPARATKS